MNNFFIALDNVANILFKVLIIDVAIVAIRTLFTAAWHNAWPTKIHTLIEHSNRYYYWFINGLELATILGLMYAGFSIPQVVFITFSAISMLNYGIRKFLAKL